MNKGIFVTGIGTEVGKTLVSAILTEALEADYWKPIQSGDLDWSDTMKVQSWISNKKTIFHPEAYRLQTPMSPHAAAAIDGLEIDLQQIILPKTENFLLVEGAGGLFVPLNEQDCIIDLIAKFQLPVVLVSRHYLGSINHTLLSIEALRSRKIPIAALIFSGAAHHPTESIIEKMSGIKALCRIDELKEINKQNIQEVANDVKDIVQKQFY